MDQFSLYAKFAQDWLIATGPNIVFALLILVFGRWMALWVSRLTQKTLVKAGMDKTLVRFLDKLAYYTLLAVVILAAADQAGIKTTSFLAILGAAGLAVGLALKDSLANFASGVMIILFRPFKVGNVVTVAGVTGKVERIDIFSSILHTPDNQKIIIPNSAITSDVIINITANPTRRIDLIIGISYDDNLKEAKEVLEDIIQSDSRILTDPAPSVVLGELGASSVDLYVRPWTRTEDSWDVKCDLVEKIKLTFDEKGISFPFPQQDVHMYQHKAE